MERLVETLPNLSLHFESGIYLSLLMITQDNYNYKIINKFIAN